MALKRKTLQAWEGVKFQNFPLRKVHDGKRTDTYIFGGRNFSLTGHWGGVVYTGRYRVYIPAGLKEEDFLDGIWDVKKMYEKVSIIDAKGENLTLDREYFTVYPSQETDAKFYIRFVGGHFKTTLAGIGRDRNYDQYVTNNDAMTLATTRNHCRSGRYGAHAAMLISPNKIKVHEEGEF